MDQGLELKFEQPDSKAINADKKPSCELDICKEYQSDKRGVFVRICRARLESCSEGWTFTLTLKSDRFNFQHNRIWKNSQIFKRP